MTDSNDKEIDLSVAGPANIEIDLSDDAESQPQDGGGDSPERDFSRPATIDAPSPSPGTYTRGTFVFPSDQPGFMQRLELCGNNGAQRDVETVYILTGDTYTMPTELLQLDDPAVYTEMTETSVTTKLQPIAKQLARMYNGRPDPNLIAYAHTHPSSSTRPSEKDKEDSEVVEEVFAEYFDDFEFFNIIHALGDKADVPVDKMREPQESGGDVWWYGETRRHELAVFDAHFNSRDVVVR